jgi:fatty-acyl-CoA synthase/long-chain acyl-CoA synthetase
MHAAATPDKPAVVDDRPGRPPLVWSFAELNRQVNRLAHVLRGLGLAPGERLAVCGPNSPGVVQAMHARGKLGATLVPLNYRLTPDEAAYVLADSDTVVAWVDHEQAGLFEQIQPRLPALRHVLVFGGPPGPRQLDGERLLAEAPDTEPPPVESDVHPVSMLYTSGTTGRPKGAVRRAADPVGLGLLLQHMGHRPDDVYLTTGPLYHSGPGGYLAIAHLLGNIAVLQRRFDPEDWLRLVATYRVSMTFAAPTPIRMVLGLPAGVKARYDRSSMRLMVANAAPWPYALKEAYLADFPEDSLWEVYGSTELGVDTVLAPADQRRKPGSCGRPAPGVEIKLFDPEGREIGAPHVPGELYVRSTASFATYHKAQASFEASRRGDFLTVGDIAYRDEEGYYYICDRKHDMIITGGMNVYPAEVEAALERHPAVLMAAAFGIPSEEWGESVHAVVVLRPGGPAPTAEELIAFVRGHLAGYKVPRSLSFAPELPHTGSGKVLRRALREPYWQGRRSRV